MSVKGVIVGVVKKFALDHTHRPQTNALIALVQAE
jgi:hypothetical protein